MLFSSPLFLFLFLPIVLGMYYLLPRKGRNLFLLISSLSFYTFGELELVLVMLTSVVVDYGCGILIEKGHRKKGLYISLAINLGLLIFFKYTSFALENYYQLLEYAGIQSASLRQLPHIALPLGISFYTFQTLSYTLDVYGGKVKATRNFIDFATYVTFFPQLIAGPIVRYRDIQTQLTQRRENQSQFAEGIERFIIGLAKKVIIADSLLRVVNLAFNSPIEELSMSLAWLGLIAFFIQVYFDFSGYSDMAIGLGKLFGFEFPENFNYPYIARSVKGYWRRWHITLGSWFRDYMFIPLGGSRRAPLRVYFNMFLVFLTIGIWHGANWNMVVFGCFHSVIMIAERLFRKTSFFPLPKWLGHVYLIFAILMSYVIFRTDSLSHCWGYYQALWGWGAAGEQAFFVLNTELKLILGLGIFLSFPVYPWLMKAIQRQKDGNIKFGFAIDLFWKVALLGLFILTASYVASSVYQPFFYFRF